MRKLIVLLNRLIKNPDFVLAVRTPLLCGKIRFSAVEVGQLGRRPCPPSLRDEMEIGGVTLGLAGKSHGRMEERF